jgi:excisionase family DNA binding protein
MLYKKKEAYKLLNIGERSIDRAVIDGRLKCRRIGTAIRFTRDDLEQFVGGRLFADAEKPPTPEGLIPSGIVAAFEKELSGINHGSVTLTVHLRDGKPRFVIGREQSFLQDGKEHEKTI